MSVNTFGIGTTILASQPRLALIVDASDSDVFTYNSSGPVYAGVQFNSNDQELTTPASGTSGFTASLGDWLSSGNPNEVWVKFTYVSGTLTDWNSLGAKDTLINCSTNPSYRIVRNSGNGQTTITGYFTFYDNSGGTGTPLDTTTNRTFRAEIGT